jgi:hypothetical protein
VRLRWVLFVLACAVQLFVLYSPSQPGGGPPFPYGDKLGHLVIFGLVAFTGRRAGLPALWLGLALVAHAALSEVAQGTLLPERSGDPFDALADTAGVVLGLWLAGLLSGRSAPAKGRDAGS